jgi:hypothetical protein
VALVVHGAQESRYLIEGIFKDRAQSVSHVRVGDERGMTQ